MCNFQNWIKRRILSNGINAIRIQMKGLLDDDHDKTNERYRIIEKISEGQFGTVFRAFDQKMSNLKRKNFKLSTWMIRYGGGSEKNVHKHEIWFQDETPNRARDQNHEFIGSQKRNSHQFDRNPGLSQTMQ